jgi:hypothetical protein
MTESLAKNFPEVPTDVLERATDLALTVLQDEETPNRLSYYYDPSTDYVGRSFVDLEPRDSSRVTAADLMAVSMLDISFPASAVRRLLDNPETQQEISTRLQALPQRPLESTTAEDVQVMSAFYDSIKPLLSNASSRTSNRWVAASKLTARKRPDLFPIRDRVVCGHLGLLPLRDKSKDWMVFRHIMRNEKIQTLLAALPAEIASASAGEQTNIDLEPLRILDAAIWMYAR